MIVAIVAETGYAWIVRRRLTMGRQRTALSVSAIFNGWASYLVLAAGAGTLGSGLGIIDPSGVGTPAAVAALAALGAGALAGLIGRRAPARNALASGAIIALCVLAFGAPVSTALTVVVGTTASGWLVQKLLLR